MRALLEKYRSVILYLVFGVLTTLVNIAAYFVCYKVLSMPNLVSTAIAWLLSVIFAFVTNKIWVFESRTSGLKDLLYELGTFFSCRIATGVLDMAVMFFAVDVMDWNSMLWKLISNVIVVVLNYIASKLIIFRKKQ